MEQVDFIIVGQGLCGTLLSWMLVRAGCKVKVVDEPKPHTPSKVACGLINPVTGMRVAKAWRIDELLPVARSVYSAVAADLGCTIFTPLDIVEFHRSPEERNIFQERTGQYPDYLLHESVHQQHPAFEYYFGASVVTGGGLTDMGQLMEAWRRELVANNLLLEEQLNWENCSQNGDCVTYKNIRAERIICCDGNAGLGNPYFYLLPFALTKGEALIASIPGLSRDSVFKHGIKIAPWGEDLFWIGASFEWAYDNELITAAFRTKTENELRQWLKLPFEVREHWASVRPATVDHKPFVGFHPHYPRVGILNGMGAKGCSQAPFFAENLVKHLVSGTAIDREADVARFTKALSRAK